MPSMARWNFNPRIKITCSTFLQMDRCLGRRRTHVDKPPLQDPILSFTRHTDLIQFPSPIPPKRSWRNSMRRKFRRSTLFLGFHSSSAVFDFFFFSDWMKCSAPVEHSSYYLRVAVSGLVATATKRELELQSCL